MNKMLALVLLIACGTALGQEPYKRLVTLDTNGVGSVTFGNMRGELDAVYVSSATTADVAVAYSPAGDGVGDIDVATNTVALTKVFRPRVKGTDVAGADVTDYSRYILAGEDVGVTVTNGASLASWVIVLILK